MVFITAAVLDSLTYVHIKQPFAMKLLAASILFCFYCLAAFAQPPLVKQWDYRYGGTNGDVLSSSLHQTTDGGYVLGGYSKSDSSGDKTQNSRGYDDYWLVR